MKKNINTLHIALANSEHLREKSIKIINKSFAEDTRHLDLIILSKPNIDFEQVFRKIDD